MQIILTTDYLDDVFDVLADKPFDHDTESSKEALQSWKEEVEKGDTEFHGSNALEDATFIHDTDRYWE